MTQKSTFLNSEGDAWFNRNRQSVETKYQYPELDFIASHFIEFNRSKKLQFLEVGCAAGHKTQYLQSILENSIGFGIDPSPQAIESAIQRSVIINNKDLNFKIGTADNLEYPANYFDLIFFGFCLYLVEDELLDKVFENLNISLKKNSYVAILDFDAGAVYRNPYSHKEGIFSYKRKYSKLLEDQGYYLVSKISLRQNGTVNFEFDPDLRISCQVFFRESK